MEFFKKRYSSNQHQENYAVNNKTKNDIEKLPSILARKVKSAINISKTMTNHLELITL